MNVLFVCTGNLCRSPMAEALFKLIVRSRRYDDEIHVRSAGTWASKGSPATPDAVDVLAAVGVDLAAHRSRPLRRAHIEWADLVVAMTSVHSLEIQEKVPDAASKIVLLKEVLEMETEPASPTTPSAERLEAFLRAKRPRWRRALDLDDPMGLPRTAYIRCLKEIWDGVERLADAISPRTDGDELSEEIEGEAEASA